MPFLWLISQSVNDGHDTYDSAVVCAATENDARHINPSGHRIWMDDRWHFKFCDGTIEPESGSDYWAMPENVSAALIGIPSNGIVEGAVICASFNAG